MSTVASITIISPTLPVEQRHRHSSHIHRDLLWGSPVEYAIKAALTAREYHQLLPDDRQSDADMDTIPRDPHELKAVFAKVYDYLRLHSQFLPCQHWLNKYEDDIGKWSSGASVVDDADVKWEVSGSWDMAHRDELLVTSRQNKHDRYWIPAQPDIIVGGKRIRVRTETWFEFCRQDIEAIIYACTLATQLKLHVAWTFG